MRKPTSILHYGAGVVAALVTQLYSIPIGLSIVVLFVVLEIWDAMKGRNSWWDLQEFIVGYHAAAVRMLMLLLLALICGTPVCEVCS